MRSEMKDRIMRRKFISDVARLGWSLDIFCGPLNHIIAYVCVEDGQSRSSAQYRVVPGSSFWFVGVAPFSNDAQRNQYEGLDKTIYTTLQCAELLL